MLDNLVHRAVSLQLVRKLQQISTYGMNGHYLIPPTLCDGYEEVITGYSIKDIVHALQCLETNNAYQSDILTDANVWMMHTKANTLSDVEPAITAECPSCGHNCDQEDLSEYKGVTKCEGCWESADEVSQLEY